MKRIPMTKEKRKKNDTLFFMITQKVVPSPQQQIIRIWNLQEKLSLYSHLKVEFQK